MVDSCYLRGVIMPASNRTIMLITALGLCLVPVACDSSNQKPTATSITDGSYPSREECGMVKVGMTLEEAVAILGQYGFTFSSADGTPLQVAWCYGSCDPAEGDGVLIAHLDQGTITKVQFAAEPHFTHGS